MKVLPAAKTTYVVSTAPDMDVDMDALTEALSNLIDDLGISASMVNISIQ